LYIFAYTPKLLRTIIGILLFDSNKIERLYLLFKGFLDGLSSKMGKPRKIEG